MLSLCLPILHLWLTVDVQCESLDERYTLIIMVKFRPEVIDKLLSYTDSQHYDNIALCRLSA